MNTNKHAANVFPVILSGGAGTRLWPLSREHYPKQLLDLMGTGETMIQSTARRVINYAAPIIVCSDAHRFMVAQQLHEKGIKPNSILLEPTARNTAPAITLAAWQAHQLDPESIIAVFPADHHIKDVKSFEEALGKAVIGAKQGYLTTFGVVPDAPETGFGYIKVGTEKKHTIDIMQVEEFVEKPDLSTAKHYLESGEYLWNSGMFVFSVKVFLEEMQKYHPEMTALCREALELGQSDLDFTRVENKSFSQCESTSIDYALMERSDKVAVVSLDAGWSDIGNWDALANAMEKNSESNVLIGDVLVQDTQHSLIIAEQKLVATVGIDNIVIVDTDDALLVAGKDHVQDIKSIPALLKAQKRTEHLHHRRVHRPWGSYDAIQSGERFQVKNLTVDPGASLSLQLHHHRAEHWVVVEGTAKVRIGDKTSVLSENESVYIPVGVKHRLSNPGKIPLKIIEVQSGSYLGEDDIVRFEDDYHRDQ